MENDIGVNNNGELFPNGGVENGKVVQVLQWGFDKVKGILERNRILIQEIELNQEAREAGGLSRNVALTRELSDNMARVLNLYSELSAAFSRGLAKSSPAAAAAAANERARVLKHYSDLFTSLSLAKGSPTVVDAAKEG